MNGMSKMLTTTGGATVFMFPTPKAKKLGYASQYWKPAETNKPAQWATSKIFTRKRNAVNWTKKMAKADYTVRAVRLERTEFGEIREVVL